MDKALVDGVSIPVVTTTVGASSDGNHVTHFVGGCQMADATRYASPRTRRDSPANAANEPRDERLRRVLCIYTGGTVGMKPTERGYSPVRGFLSQIVRDQPMLHDKGAEHLISSSLLGLTEDPRMGPFLISPVSEQGKRCVFRFLDYDPLLDSSNMGIAEWRKISKDVEQFYHEYDSFVILHGTDTMAFTASALAFFLENTRKTVCFTGSQIPVCRPRNDGLMNLLGAINIAAHFDIPEVVLFFNSTLFRGCRSSKIDASDLAAFGSPNMAPLAKLGISVHINWDLVRPKPARQFVLRDSFCSDVTVLRIFPGNPASLECTQPTNSYLTIPHLPVQANLPRSTKRLPPARA